MSTAASGTSVTDSLASQDLPPLQLIAQWSVLAPASSGHATLVDGTDAEQHITALLQYPEHQIIHSRNVLYGCFMFTLSNREPRQSRRSRGTPC